MKIMKKRVVSCLLAVSSLLACAGCGSTGDDEFGDVTKIEVFNFDGGVGSVWLEDFVKRFEAKYATKSYAEGKEGVKVVINKEVKNNTADMPSAGFNIYFQEGVLDFKQLAAKGYTLDITDWITEDSDTRDGQSISIEDKIDDTYLSFMKGYDGKYYGIAGEELVEGMAYDIDLFDRYNFYFADSTETSVETYTSKYGTAKFIANEDSVKSCGPDGRYDTIDDGLPSSVEEFIILCDYMKSEFSISPVALSGAYPSYINYFIIAMWRSLAGEAFQQQVNFSGECEIIQTDENGNLMLTNENLFQGIDYIKKPVTETVTLTEQTGYLATQQVEKYYAFALSEILYREEFFSKGAGLSTCTHTDIQNDFIMSGESGAEKIGMLIEGNYWYNESNDAGNFDKYEKFTGKTERNVSWMPLPTKLKGSATEGEGHALMYRWPNDAYTLVNANIKDKPEILAACKDFIQFMYSDVELDKYTANTGVTRGVEYPISQETYNSLPKYQQSCIDYRQASIIPQYNFNKTFEQHIGSFRFTVNEGLHIGLYKDFISAHKKGGKTAIDAVAAGLKTKAQWASTYYEGETPLE